MQKAKEALEYIAGLLVSNGGAVYAESTTDERGVLLLLHVAKEDMGKVIGKEGAMIKAIRYVVHGIGMQENARVSVKVAEPEGSVQ